MNYERLPNLLIIGAAKSGTTTLFDVIGQNQGVFSPKIKEIKFFSRDERYNLGVDWYINTYFQGSEKYQVRMDASPAYLTWSEKTAPRIKEVFQDHPVKFVAIFRDPVKRAYSQYWHRVRQGDEPSLSFSEAIYTEETRLKENWDYVSTRGDGLYGYFRAGCYATKLKPYLELFPRENFYFLLQDDLQIDFEKSIKLLLSFLDLQLPKQVRTIKRNISAVPRDKNLYKVFKTLKNSRIQKLISLLVPKNARKWFRNDLILKPFQYPPMEKEIKQYLYSKYIDEIKQLEMIIDRDLSHWYTGKNP